MTVSKLPFISGCNKIADFQSVEMSRAIVDPNERRGLCKWGQFDRKIGSAVIVKSSTVTQSGKAVPVATPSCPLVASCGERNCEVASVKT